MFSLAHSEFQFLHKGLWPSGLCTEWVPLVSFFQLQNSWFVCFFQHYFWRSLLQCMCLTAVSKIKVTVAVWAYFWTLHSVSLAHDWLSSQHRADLGAMARRCNFRLVTAVLPVLLHLEMLWLVKVLRVSIHILRCISFCFGKDGHPNFWKYALNLWMAFW